MIKALKAIGIDALHIDFSHVGIFSSLVKDAALDESLEQALYAALLGKDQSSVRTLAVGLDPTVREALSALTELNGGIATLDLAEKRLPSTPEIRAALQDLRAVSAGLADMDVDVCFDLAELRGYHYHSGMIFAAYAQGYAGPLAMGGRYDEVGSVFGRARPATGFSLDLRGVVSALPPAELEKAILAPSGHDIALLQKIDTLRAQGHIVIQELPGGEAYRAELGCNKRIVNENGGWIVVDAPELLS
jgi:ATP phosphoribosyltransferase regulatory subunit